MGFRPKGSNTTKKFKNDADAKPEHERAPALTLIDQDYASLSEAYPLASLPYVRRHHIAFVQNRPGDAIDLIERALLLVDNDPYLQTGPDQQFHWLQSFVRRRLIALKIPEPALLPVPNGGIGLARERLQIDELALAVEMLMVVERLDPRSLGDKAWETETERRTNNIIYYASRMLERGGSKDLAALVSDPALDAMARRLAPSGVEDVNDLGRLHTLGCYFAVRGNVREASMIGKLILSLISKRLTEGGPKISLDKPYSEEAWSWVNNDDKVAPERPASMHALGA